MKLVTIALVCVFMNIFKVCSSQNNFKNNYLTHLILCLKNIEKGDTFINDSALLKCIPHSEQDYIKFYHITDSLELNLVESFSMMEKLVPKRASQNIKVCIRWFEMAKYVDGEYADRYFDSIDNFKKRYNKIYHLALKKCNSSMIKRLKI